MPRPDARQAAPRAVAAVLLAACWLLAGCVPAPLPDGPASRAPAETTERGVTRPTPETGRSGPPAPRVPRQSAELSRHARDAAPEPVRVVIDAVGVEVAVDPVGVATDGQMEIPALAERAGWYRYGPSPGQARGTAVLAAHVDSVATGGLGPFARFVGLSATDDVVVELSDGSEVVYQVVSIEQHPKSEITWAEVFVRDGVHRLVLITCGGDFLHEAGHYADNIVVTAAPANQ